MQNALRVAALYVVGSTTLRVCLATRLRLLGVTIERATTPNFSSSSTAGSDELGTAYSHSYLARELVT